MASDLCGCVQSKTKSDPMSPVRSFAASLPALVSISLICGCSCVAFLPVLCVLVTSLDVMLSKAAYWLMQLHFVNTVIVTHVEDVEHWVCVSCRSSRKSCETTMSALVAHPTRCVMHANMLAALIMCCIAIDTPLLLASAAAASCWCSLAT